MFLYLYMFLLVIFVQIDLSWYIVLQLLYKYLSISRFIFKTVEPLFPKELISYQFYLIFTSFFLSVFHSSPSNVSWSNKLDNLALSLRVKFIAVTYSNLLEHKSDCIVFYVLVD
jgi:hypothetical protein